MHDLDLHSYSLSELFSLFDLPEEASLEDLKRAKKKVLHMHPDKSKLPAEYFRFYKQAFEIIVHLFQKEKVVDISPNEQIKSNIEKMPAAQFQKEFNRLFDAHMKKPTDDKNKWFSEEGTEAPKVQSLSQFRGVFDSLKANQITVFKDVEPVVHRHGTGLYDEEDEYITTDPFAKLKFEDLRKVHKDQTIFAVDENSRIPTYSLEQYQRTREVYTPIDRQQSTQMLEENQRRQDHKIREKQYASEIKLLESEEKNKSVWSRFLQLNG